MTAWLILALFFIYLFIIIKENTLHERMNLHVQGTDGFKFKHIFKWWMLKVKTSMQKKKAFFFLNSI